MNYIIATYPDYNARRYGTPWAAPCDSTGRPCFKGKTGHFTGGHGKGGHLFVEDPDEGSIWCHGQKDYRGNNTEKVYSQFMDGCFFPLPTSDLVEALNEAPQQVTTDKRKDEILRVLFQEIAAAEFTGEMPTIAKIMEDHKITRAEVEKLGGLTFMED